MRAIERHVRTEHLHKTSADEDEDGEEEFYYTEMETEGGGGFDFTRSLRWLECCESRMSPLLQPH